MTDWAEHHLAKGWVVTHRTEESEEALALGRTMLAAKTWPASVRFDFNPRLSDAEEVYLSTLVESGLTEAQAVEALRATRPILEVEFLSPL